jgi:hypothetical protein
MRVLSHFKMLSDCKYSIHKITQFSQGNNVLHPPVSNIDSFLPTDTELLPFTLMELFCTKVLFLTLENPQR